MAHRTAGPQGLRAGHPVDRAGDGGPDPGPDAGPRLARCRGLVLVLGLLALWPFARFELGVEEPLIDVRLLAHGCPVAGAADRVPVRHVGARRADPAVHVRPHRPRGDRLRARRLGGLRVHADRRLRDLAGRRGAAPARSSAGSSAPAGRCSSACLLVALGYGLFIPLHDSTAQTLANMAIAGIGSGALVAALPAAAAAAAPADRTGFVTGMTNTTKTIGGAIASSIFAIALASTGSIADAEAGPCPAVGLPHRVGGLLADGPDRGGQPVRRTQGRVRGLTLSGPFTRRRELAGSGWCQARTACSPPRPSPSTPPCRPIRRSSAACRCSGTSRSAA